MYDEDGNVLVTETQEEFEAAARPDVDPALKNHCVEGKLEWLDGGEPITSEVLIPTDPGGRGHDLAVPRRSWVSPSTGCASTRPHRSTPSSAPTRSPPSTTAAGTSTRSRATTCTGRSAAPRSVRPRTARPPSSGTPSTGTRSTAPTRRTPTRRQPGSTSATATPRTPLGYHYHANQAKKNLVIAVLHGPDRRVRGRREGQPGGGGPPDGAAADGRRPVAASPDPRIHDRGVAMPSRTRHLSVALAATLMLATACGSSSERAPPARARELGRHQRRGAPSTSRRCSPTAP